MNRLRSALRRLLWMALGAVVAGAGVFTATRLSGPPLQPWHTWAPRSDYHGRRGEIRDFRDYRALEEALARELDTLLAGLDPGPLSRYGPDHPLRGRVRDADWNRSVELAVERPRGVALLLHGMSDSPYSLRALARRLHAEGLHVLALRLPGHGTAPAVLTRTTWQDMAAAVRLGVGHLRPLLREGTALVVVGYSNGAALALDYTLDALADDAWPVPERLVLISPAIAVSEAARFAPVFVRAGRIPGLAPLAWLSVQPEYDPYKYNSFPLNAGEQVYRLAVSVQRRLDALDAAAWARFPPVLAAQSVVDATVVAPAVVERLMSRLRSGADELLIFDVNREATIVELFARYDHGRVRALLEDPAPYAVTVVGNRAPDTRRVDAKRRPAGGGPVRAEPLDMAWPRGVYSLSHVALPIAPDDPVYGRGGAGAATLGNLELHGEQDLLRVPAAQLMRLRYNPFHAYLERRVLEFLGVAVAGASPGEG
jgi:alpha-beta hydrolase superfamily lysophospholipase